MREERQNRPRSFTSEKGEPVNADKGLSETSQLQTGEDDHYESRRSSKPNSAVS
jgi:hypothetical protein